MKKVISVKEIMIILISLIIIAMSTTVLGTGLVLGEENTANNASVIDKNEYANAQNITVENNTIANNTITNNTSVNNTSINNVANKAKTYNTNNTTDLPQTGIEDYNVGILLVIGIASAIYAYKKISDYKNV